MNCRRRMGAGSPNASKMKDPSKEAGDKATYDDKHGMEYRPVRQNPEHTGPGKQIDWKK
jgi:hypothetical protein